MLMMYIGEDMVVCMTRQFDTLHEEPLRTEDFGEGGSYIWPRAFPFS